MRVLEQQQQQGGQGVRSSSRSHSPISQFSDAELSLVPQPDSPIVVEAQSLTTQRIDALSEAECDWISPLSADWQVDSSSCRGLGLPDHRLAANRSYLSVGELISLLRQGSDQGRGGDGVYTCCARVVGLGRVRLVIRFDTSRLRGEASVLVTNRLDWSPRRILAAAQVLYELGASDAPAC